MLSFLWEKYSSGLLKDFSAKKIEHEAKYHKSKTDYFMVVNCTLVLAKIFLLKVGFLSSYFMICQMPWFFSSPWYSSIKQLDTKDRFGFHYLLSNSSCHLHLAQKYEFSASQSYCIWVYTTQGGAIHIDINMNGTICTCAVYTLHRCKSVLCI